MFQCHSDVTHPCYTHNNLLPLLLGNTLPFFDDLCKRSARFILECIQSDSSLVRSVARFGIVAGFVNSFTVRNVVFLCSYFGWQFSEFVQGRINLCNAWFLSHFYDKVTGSDWCAAQSLLDIMNIREGSSVLKFSDDSTFSASKLSFIMLCVATNRMD